MSKKTFKSYKKEVIKMIEGKVDERADKVGAYVVKKQRLISPIDTGNLRKHIGYDVEKGRVRVGVEEGVDYAKNVSIGTKRQEPNDYIQRSVFENAEKIKNIIEKK